jgi:hypothetical protein
LPPPTPTRTPTPGGAFYQSVEAESGVLSSAMSAHGNVQAFGGQYISSSTQDAGTAVLTVNVPSAGTYYVWGRVLAPDDSHDSFYSKANGGSEDIYDDAQGTWSPNWQWTVLNGRGGTDVPLTIDPRTFSLAAGANTIVFRGREPGSKLDRILVTNDASYVPTDGNTVTFPDAPPSNPFFDYIEIIAANAITNGCGGGNFCPNGVVTRAQMAVLLLKGKHGSSYQPPPATGTVFTDVHTSTFAAAWIERLAAEGITGGCGNGKYCPGNAVTREQMAVLLLRAKHGASYTPPAATGIFDDVPVSSPFASWIEQLSIEGVTAGCGNGNYCPDNANTRGQMAVFLVRTFNLS